MEDSANTKTREDKDTALNQTRVSADPAAGSSSQTSMSADPAAGSSSQTSMSADPAAGSSSQTSVSPEPAAGSSSQTSVSADPAAGSSSGSSGRRDGRLKLFNKVLERSLQRVMEDASFQRFAKTFHPIYKRNPQVMENIHKQFIADLQRTIQEDISMLVEEGELECKLDELDKMERASKNDKEPAWRPSGVPEEDLCSFVMPYYMKQEAYLQKELKKVQAENAALARRVQSGRETIASTELRIATAVDQWRESVKESRRLTASLCPADALDL